MRQPPDILSSNVSCTFPLALQGTPLSFSRIFYSNIPMRFGVYSSMLTAPYQIKSGRLHPCSTFPWRKTRQILGPTPSLVGWLVLRCHNPA